jgi:hypothetical protein
MIIDSVEVAIKEIVVSLWILLSHSLFISESVVRQVVWVTAHRTKRIRGSPGGWLDFSDEPTRIDSFYRRPTSASSNQVL